MKKRKIEIGGGYLAKPPIYEDLRLTISCIEALVFSGNRVEPNASEWWTIYRATAQYQIYRITLGGTVPPGIVECLIGHDSEQHRGLRLKNEPEYPGEWSDGGGVACRERGQWVPCPKPRCGRALVWYEVGNVFGYCVCTRGHHAQLSADGRSAVPQ